MQLLVVAPAALELPASEGVRVLRYTNSHEAAAALRARTVPAVFVSDGLRESELEEVAQAVQSGPAAAVIEVRAQRWDGRSWSPVSAACRGVISGFGPRGVEAALRALRAL